MKHKSLQFIPLESGLRVDVKDRILYGAQVAMAGEAKGHGMLLDGTTLDQIVELGNAKPNGVKVRFGHPSMCTPAIGTFLGVRKNFVRDGDYVRADLYMSKAADPDKAKHVMDMAMYAPDQIGNSVVVSCELEYQTNSDGSIKKDEDGHDLLPIMRVTSLEAVDVVDQPAAGDGMFAEPVEEVDLSARTIIELRNAMDKPGFVERVRKFLGIQDSPESETADSDVSEEEVSMELTLSKLLGEYPAVAAEHAATLSAEKDVELAAARKAGADSERARIVSLLGECKPCHFAKTAEHPKGFVHHAVEANLSETEFLRGMLALSDKAVTLSALESGSADIPVESASPVDKQLSVNDVKRVELLAAVEAYNKKGGV